MRPVIIIMVKAPQIGKVKTRLSPPLSTQEAAALAACFVQDVTAMSLRVLPDVIIAYAPRDGRPILEKILPGHLLWLEQQGTDLGERLEAAISSAASFGFGPIIVIGADSPTLPDVLLKTACDVLINAEADVVLGPTADGGYYLVGLQHPVPHLFQNIAWSTRSTYNQTVANIREQNLRLHELSPWYDVDTFADLLQLRDELATDTEARLRAPTTYCWITSHRLA